MLQESTQQTRTMHKAQIKKFTPLITEKDVCVFSGYKHSYLYSYKLNEVYFYKKKIISSPP